MVHKCTKQCLFIENIEHYIKKQRDTLNLSDLLYFSTHKSGRERFNHNAKGNLISFSSVFSLVPVVLNRRDKLENLSYHLVWLFKNVYHAD